MEAMGGRDAFCFLSSLLIFLSLPLFGSRTLEYFGAV